MSRASEWSVKLRLVRTHGSGAIGMAVLLSISLAILLHISPATPPSIGQTILLNVGQTVLLDTSLEAWRKPLLVAGARWDGCDPHGSRTEQLRLIFTNSELRLPWVGRIVDWRWSCS